MADNSNQTDKHNVQKQGEKFQATVTRYFDDMDTAVQWAESTYSTTAFPDEPNDEPAASDMSEKDAEKLNSQVNPAPIPAGAEQVLSGGGSSNDGTTQGAPAPDEAANELAVDNTAAGTFDPNGQNSQQEAKSAPDKPQTSNKN